MTSPVRFPTSPIQEQETSLAQSFALTGDPFAVNSAGGAFVPIPAHAAALDALRRWIGEMRGDPDQPNRLGVLTGESGTGKSHLLAKLIDAVDDDRLHLVRLPDVPSHRTDAQLLKAIIVALDADPVGRSGLELRGEVRDALHAVGEKGVQTGLLIDDADFKGSQLELIRNLLRDAAGTGFWIILAGTPDLHDRMRRRRSLRGMMGPVVSLDDLPNAHLSMLVQGCLDTVRTDATPDPLVPASALATLAEWAQGNPARMLHATHSAMLAAAGANQDTVSADIAREAVRQLTVAEANEARAAVVAARERPIQAQMTLPDVGPSTSSRATTQRSLWDGKESV